MSTSRRLSFVRCFLCIALGLACASPPGISASSPAATRGSNSDVITLEELADPSHAGSNLLEAIRRLRPRFLNDRGAGLRGESQGVQASINGATLVPVGELARMGTSEVTEIRYLSTADAGLRFGLAGSLGPVLLITITPR